MNRVLISTSVVLAVVVGMLLNMQQVLSADDQAVVVRNTGLPCGIFAGDAGGMGEVTLLLENANKVMMKCKGTDLPNPAGIEQTAEGFLCGAVGPDGTVYETEDSQAAVSESGVGTLTCTYHK